MPTLTIVRMLFCDQGMTNLVEVYDNGQESPTPDYLALIDCGSGKKPGSLDATIKKDLLSSIAAKAFAHGRLDLLVLSHQDSDHVNLLGELGKEIDRLAPHRGLHVTRLYKGGSNWTTGQKALDEFKTFVTVDTEFLTDGMQTNYATNPPTSLSEHPGVALRLIISGVPSSSRKRNASSAVIAVEASNFVAMLPGDTTSETMSEINKMIMRHEIPDWTLKTMVALALPHHGSIVTARGSHNALDTFTILVHPTVIAASAGSTSEYRHPSQTLINAFDRPATLWANLPTHYYQSYLAGIPGEHFEITSKAIYTTACRPWPDPAQPRRLFGDIVFKLQANLPRSSMVAFKEVTHPRSTRTSLQNPPAVLYAPAP